MRRHLCWSPSGVVAAVVLAGMLPLAAGPGHAAAARTIRPSGTAHTSHQAPVVIAFGREGGNIRPLTVTIDSAGVVKTNGAPGHAQLSPDALHGLLTLATAEGFSRMPGRMIGRGLPDVGGRFVTIHTSSGTKTVHVRFVRNSGFDQLYAVLAAVAGVAG